MKSKLRINESRQNKKLFKDVMPEAIEMEVDLLLSQNRILKRLIYKLKIENNLLKENLYN
jgi:hypothetical protein